MLVALLAVYWWMEPPSLAPLYRPKPDHEFRTLVSEEVGRIREVVPDDSDLFVVFPLQEEGLLHPILSFEMSPVRVVVGEYNFLDRPADLVFETLREYDYVWFMMLTPQVERQLQYLFDRAPGSRAVLYRLGHESGGVQLTPVF